MWFLSTTSIFHFPPISSLNFTTVQREMYFFKLHDMYFILGVTLQIHFTDKINKLSVNKI